MANVPETHHKEVKPEAAQPRRRASAQPRAQVAAGADAEARALAAELERVLPQRDRFEKRPGVDAFHYGGVTPPARPEASVSRVTKPHFARLLAMSPAERAEQEEPIKRAVIECFGLRTRTVQSIPAAELDSVTERLIALREPGATLSAEVPQEGGGRVTVRFRVVRVELDGRSSVFAIAELGVTSPAFRIPIAV